MSDISKRAHIESQLMALYDVTTADAAYDIIDNTFTPPKRMDGEAFATWDYHAERTRRQMVGAVLGEKAAAVTTERLAAHLDRGIGVVIPSTETHPARSDSLQDHVSTMDYWFSDVLAEVSHSDPTAKALVEAGNRRRPLFRQAVVGWLKYQHAKGKNLDWELPPLDTDTGEDITMAYRLNMASEVPTQFLIFGLDTVNADSERPANPPDILAHSRLYQFPAFTSTVHEISAPVMGPFVAYDPETGANEHQKGKDTPQSLYSAWQRDPSPENTAAFLQLAGNSDIRANLQRMYSLPGAGRDGRSPNPGHCHIDMRIVREDRFPVPPRELLVKLGERGLAETDYMNMATLISAVGFHAAKDTIYKNWPGQQAAVQERHG